MRNRLMRVRRHRTLKSLRKMRLKQLAMRANPPMLIMPTTPIEVRWPLKHLTYWKAADGSERPTFFWTSKDRRSGTDPLTCRP